MPTAEEEAIVPKTANAVGPETTTWLATKPQNATPATSVFTPTSDHANPAILSDFAFFLAIASITNYVLSLNVQTVALYEFRNL
ncbi:MAG: hypothetical protein ACI9S8_001347 [Chlamydiales bacterium]|jgi:hypothetical protein